MQAFARRTRLARSFRRQPRFEALELRCLLSSYVVNDPGSAGLDPAVGPGMTSSGTITLQSAIDEANLAEDTGGSDKITFAFPMTITTTGFQLLPGVQIDIDGGAPGAVTIRSVSPSSSVGFEVFGTQSVIENLTISGFNVGVEALESEQYIDFDTIVDCGTGVSIEHGNVTVINNFIGTDSLSHQNLGNTTGVSVQIPDGLAQLGDTVQIISNVISGNTEDGIDVKNYPATSVTIRHNWIGTDQSGTANGIGNGVAGASLSSTFIDGGSLVIGRSPDDLSAAASPDPDGNFIAYNGHAAIVTDGHTNATIRANSIYNNGPATLDGYTSAPGIDTGNNGRDVKSGPISSLVGPTPSKLTGDLVTRIVGAFDPGFFGSAAGLSYTIDFYSSPSHSLSDARQGKSFIGSTVATADSTGLATFDYTLRRLIPADASITATATESSGRTSEFQLMITRPVFVLPGIGGVFPIGDYGKWLLKVGYDPELLVADPIAHSYDDLLATLQNLGYKLGQTLFSAVYDWRVDPGPIDGTPDGMLTDLTADSIDADLAAKRYANGVDYLAYWMKKAANAFATDYPQVPLDSVNIIAHSTGGLVARSYIQSRAYAQADNWNVATSKFPAVNQLVLLASPLEGAPKAFNVSNDNWIDNIVYQYVFSSVVDAAWSKLEQGLTITLPNGTLTRSDVLKPDGTLDDIALIRKYIPTIYDLDSVRAFLDPGNGVLTTLNDPSSPYYSFRSQLLLDLNARLFEAYSHEIVNVTTAIFGTGLSTVVSTTQEAPTTAKTVFPFNALRSQAPTKTWFLDNRALAGDGTVPVTSSNPESLSMGQAGVYRAFPLANVEHQSLPSQLLTQKYIGETLGFVITDKEISTSKAASSMIDALTSKDAYIIVFELDPVGALLSDNQGRRLGDTAATGPVKEIPGSAWLGDDTAGLGIAVGESLASATLTLYGAGGPYSVVVRGQNQRRGRVWECAYRHSGIRRVKERTTGCRAGNEQARSHDFAGQGQCESRHNPVDFDCI